MLKMKRILVPVDFSKESDLALDWAVMIAKENRDATIELLHVMPEIMAPIGPEMIAFDYSRMEAAEQKATEGKLKKLLGRIPKTLESAYSVGRGNIAAETERVCREKAIDLVIMTTHGRKGLSHFLQGSTSEETVRLAPCPVLVLHQNVATQEAARIRVAI